jgi:hypothetical protein
MNKSSNYTLQSIQYNPSRHQLECAMSTASNVRRRSDGSIDIDHYRRIATRQRAAALRRMHRRLGAAISRIVAAFGTKAPGRLPAPQPAAR